MSKRNGQVFVAKDDAAIELADGTSVIVHKGRTRVREGHPLLDGREYLFEPLKIDFEVEDATADPGKKRGE